MRPILAVFCAILAFASIARAQDRTWPREINTSKGVLTIYQPQPEKFEGNLLEARCAMSLLAKGKSSPVFGVVWFTARVDTDKGKGQALLRDLKVTNARWPESTKEKETEFTVFLTDLLPKTGIPISMARLEASLAALEKEQKSIEDLKHDPPKIVFAQEPSELVLYDGTPRTMPIEKTELEYVANCIFAVLKDKKTGTYYLSGNKMATSTIRKATAIAWRRTTSSAARASTRGTASRADRTTSTATATATSHARTRTAAGPTARTARGGTREAGAATSTATRARARAARTARTAAADTAGAAEAADSAAAVDGARRS